jgi:hypothetical protein
MPRSTVGVVLRRLDLGLSTGTEVSAEVGT